MRGKCNDEKLHYTLDRVIRFIEYDFCAKDTIVDSLGRL